MLILLSHAVGAASIECYPDRLWGGIPSVLHLQAEVVVKNRNRRIRGVPEESHPKLSS